MTKSADILVLGAGLAGLSTAIYLQRDGHDVMLLDRSEPGQGASFGNAGIFANYATLPIASRQTLSALPGQILDRRSAISVRAHYWPTMLRFGGAFLRQTTPAAFARNRGRLVNLLHAADAAFDELLGFAGAEDLLVRRGCLAIYRDPRNWEAVRTQQLPMREADGVVCRAVGPAEIAELEPALAGARAVGGVLYPETRHLVSPAGLSRRLFETFRRHGGRFEQADIHRIDPGTCEAPAVELDDGVMTARRVVIALGPASGPLLAPLGLDIPLVSERGYHVTLEPGSVSLSRPVGWLERHLYATPMSDGVRVAGTTEFARPEARPDKRRWAQLGRWASTLFGDAARVASRWHGSRATTPDGLPVLGSLRQHPALIVATGHGHLGVTLSGITGRLVAEHLRGDTPSYDLKDLGAERFSA